MKSEFVTAIAQLSAEKNLDTDTVFQAVEAAMASAYKKDELQYAEIEVKIDIESGDIDAWRVWDVMPDEEIEDDEIQVSPERAAEMGHAGAAEGDRIREPLEASLDAGRIAASRCAARPSARRSSASSRRSRASWSPAPCCASRPAAAT